MVVGALQAMADRCCEAKSLAGAFERFLFGRDFVTDREILSHYIEAVRFTWPTHLPSTHPAAACRAILVLVPQVESDVNSSYHVFISCECAITRGVFAAVPMPPKQCMQQCLPKKPKSRCDRRPRRVREALREAAA